MQKGCNSLLLSVHGGDGYLLPILLPEPSCSGSLGVTSQSHLLKQPSVVPECLFMGRIDCSLFTPGISLRESAQVLLPSKQTSLVKFSAHIGPIGADSLRLNPMSNPKGKL